MICSLEWRRCRLPGFACNVELLDQLLPGGQISWRWAGSKFASNPGQHLCVTTALAFDHMRRVAVYIAFGWRRLPMVVMGSGWLSPRAKRRAGLEKGHR